MREATEVALMVNKSSLDPIAEARARVALRYNRARSVRPPPPDIGRLAARIARSHLPKKSAGIDRLKDRWVEIVGDSIARYCEPEKLSGAKGSRVLTLRVVPQAAPLIQHSSGEIRARVSVAAGGDISRLKIIQGPLGNRKQPPPAPPPRHLTPQEHEWLQDSAAGIEDPSLRAAIVALGRAVLVRQG